MSSWKRVLFAIGFIAAIHLFYLRLENEWDWWWNVLAGMPLVLYGLAIASRFWPYEGNKNERH